jgi:activator of HSP90 ATPase
MRITASLHGVALAFALAAPLATGIAAFTPAQAQIEETIWRDQARIEAHTTRTPAQESQVAKVPSATATDASGSSTPARSQDALVNGAGVPISPQTGVELPGYNLGGF